MPRTVRTVATVNPFLPDWPYYNTDDPTHNPYTYWVGTAGDDTLNGTGAMDYMFGNGGNDTLNGGGGNDVLVGGQGRDIIDGGAGIDAVSYLESNAGVRVSTGSGSGGDAEGDRLYNIEDIFGSGYADILQGGAGANSLWGSAGNDLLWGGAGHDKLYGGSGNDTLNGDAGGDLLDGGDGFDTVSYESSATRIVIDLSTSPNGAAGDAIGDTYVSIESFMGSRYADLMIGNSAANTLYGHFGRDELIGGGGNDVLRGDSDGDRLTGDGMGTSGSDIFQFNPNRVHAGSDKKDFVLDFQVGIDKVGITNMTRAQAFGADGKLATGYIDGDGFHLSNFDRTDNLFYDTRTETLYEIDPLYNGNGELGDLNLNATASFDRADMGPVVLQTSDFVFM